MQSFFPTQSGAPQLSDFLSFNDKGLKAAGVQTGFHDYTDNYYNSQLEQYKNNYNYWLWQQQAMYNSPEEQVKRLKAAGLNPNFNSIEGTGNLKDTPVMRGELRSNIVGNSISKENLLLNEVNSLLGAVKDGIQATSTLSGIPDDIPTYRKLLTKMLGAEVTSKRVRNSLDTIQQAFDMQTKLGISAPIGRDTLFGDTMAQPRTPELFIEPNFNQAERMAALRIRNAADSVLDDLRNGQIDLNQQRLENLKQDFIILQNNADFIGWKNGLGATGKGIDIISALLGLFNK